jgi:hypothetical protein
MLEQYVCEGKTLSLGNCWQLTSFAADLKGDSCTKTQIASPTEHSIGTLALINYKLLLDPPLKNVILILLPVSFGINCSGSQMLVVKSIFLPSLTFPYVPSVQYRLFEFRLAV